MKKLTHKEINLINKVLDELQSFCFNTTNLIDDLSTNESEEEQIKCQEYIINQLKTITNNMTTSEKAVDVSPNKIGSLEYWKHKCKVKELECNWLDALANYERDGVDDEELLDELYNESERERKLFNKLYSA